MSQLRLDKLAWVGVSLLGAASVCAQDYPNKSVRIVTASAGSGIDFNARQVAQGLTEIFGQQVIVENRIGIVPGETVSRASADGYTLLVEASSFWITPLLQKAPYDVVRDFSLITLISTAPYVLAVHPTVQAKSVNELIAMAKARPGQLNYASAGVAGGAHLAGALFASMAGIQVVHVPYKGTAAAVTDLLGGQVQFMLATPGSLLSHIKSGKLRGLAVTGTKPTDLVPGLPTVASSGLTGYEFGAMAGLFAPVKTPHAIIDRLNREVARVVARPDVKERFFGAGIEPAGGSSAQFSALVKSDLAKWARVIKEANIKAD
jgi:tripartite-type tricarboxylate transporter receptor subunit TctC